MRKHSTAQTASAAEKAQTYVLPIVTIETVKLVREAHAFQLGAADSYLTPTTIGGRIDEMLSDAARNGDEVQSFTVTVSPEALEEMARIERETQQCPDAAFVAHPANHG